MIATRPSTASLFFATHQAGGSLGAGSRRLADAIAGRSGRSGRRAIRRGLALFLGGFSVLNLLVGSLGRGFDANIWWIDLRPIPHPLDELLLASIGVALIGYGIRPGMGLLRRPVTAALTGTALIAALANAAMFYGLLAAGAIPSGFPIPFSLLIAVAMIAIVADTVRGDDDAVLPTHPKLLAGTVIAALFLFPLMQMLCFGRTDYRRAADAVVVLGARAYADGTPSIPLGDRVRTACGLYHAGLAPRLIFSGGPGDGAITEPEAMKRMAMGLGVPESAIILDEMGVNTQATIDNTIPILRRTGARRVMAVSNFYHLPRIKMTYQREGWDVYTVPAEESYTLRALPFYMLREVAGLWAYYLGAIGE
jgi:uncharacterized SAM-binding protein YcdF (DUF218 family)